MHSYNLRSLPHRVSTSSTVNDDCMSIQPLKYVKIYYEFDSPAIRCEGYMCSNNQQTGTWIYYSENGYKEYVCEFSNGEINHYVQYYYNSNIKYEGMFKNGLKHGQWKLNNPLGHLYELYEYYEGKLKAVTTYYTHIDKCESSTTYKNNKKCGNYYSWDINGKISSIGEYNNDIPVGKWEFYDSEGFLYKLVDYTNNNKIIKYYPSQLS